MKGVQLNMKKTLLYILMLLMFAVSFSVVAASDENVGTELIFVADFEDGTLNPSSKADWVNTVITSSDLTLDVVQDPTDENNSVLKVRRDGQFGFINLPFDEIQNRLNKAGEYRLTYDLYYPEEYPGFPAPYSRCFLR